MRISKNLVFLYTKSLTLDRTIKICITVYTVVLLVKIISFSDICYQKELVIYYNRLRENLRRFNELFSGKYKVKLDIASNLMEPDGILRRA